MGCGCDLGWTINSLVNYVGIGKVHEGQIQAAYLEVPQDIKEYLRECRQKNGDSRTSDLRKAVSHGLVAKRFNPIRHAEAVSAINRSKEVRSGGTLRGDYTLNGQLLRQKLIEENHRDHLACKEHQSVWVGGFDQQVLGAYIKVTRLGDFAMYARIMGHKIYLPVGIMFFLHYAILEFLSKQEMWAEGVRHLMYGGYHQGGEGLVGWKRRCLFQPVYLVRRSDASHDSDR